MGRTILIAAALTLALVVHAAAMSISGFFSEEIYLDFEFGGLDNIQFDTEIGIEASLATWTVGLFLDVEEDGWEDLEVFTSGTVGPIDVFSWFEFYAWDEGDLATDDILETWDTVVQTTLGGIDLWGVFSLVAIHDGGPTISGAGSAFGLHAQVGDAEVWTEMGFNLLPFIRWAVWNGMDAVISKIQACDLISVEEPTCSMAFDGLNVFVLFPIDCTDIGFRVGFSENGFSGFHIWAERLQTGLDWLTIDVVDIWYDVLDIWVWGDEKELDLTLTVSLGEFICLTPYGSLILDTWTSVGGIAIEGLGLQCLVNDVTFIASGLLDEINYFIGEDARIYAEDGGATHGCLLFSDCIDDKDGMDFALGMEVGGASCCAPYTFGAYAFFGPLGTGSLFEFQHLRLLYQDQLAENLSWSMEVFIDQDEPEGIEISFYYTWGEPWLVSSEESCCSCP